MNISSKYIVLGLILVSLSTCAPVRINCEANTTCQSNFQYVYTDRDGATTTECSSNQNSCRVYENSNFDIFVVNCSCSTGACITSNFEDNCVSSDTCGTVVEATIQCRDCDRASCTQDKCLFFQSTETCSSINTCPYTTATIRQENCQGGKAVFGQTCGCCSDIQFDGGIVADTQFCSNIYPFDGQILRSYATEYEANLRLGMLLIAILMVLGFSL